jgi:spermidine dehydrogenase
MSDLNTTTKTNTRLKKRPKPDSGIKRRDFLNGMAVSFAGTMLAGTRPLHALNSSLALQPDLALASGLSETLSKEYYPPKLTGMRGSHEGSYEVAHALAWRGDKPMQVVELDEEYDLIVVGGGISGLACAYLYQQQAGADKKVLILDNHDDFGGHAKRNEFSADGRTLLGFGGSINLEQDAFSDNVHTLLKDLGVDLKALENAVENDFVLTNTSGSLGYFLNAATYGRNQILQNTWRQVWLAQGDYQQAVTQLGLSALQQEKLLMLISGERDLLNDLSLLEKKDYIFATDYASFLRERAGLEPSTIALFEPIMLAIFGCGAECLSVAEALSLGSPGLKSLGWIGSLANSFLSGAMEDIRTPMFPDGNSSIARLLVRKLVPGVAGGNSMYDIASAQFDYSKLDQATNKNRIRLNSTAVECAHSTDGSRVNVTYVTAGEAYRVRAKHCILACYNALIPYLCPELPEPQKEALAYGSKTPLVYCNVLVRNGAALDKAPTTQCACPDSFFALVSKAPPVQLGEYNGQNIDGDQRLLFMNHVPAPRAENGQSVRDIYRLARHTLYATPFETFENEIKQQLNAMFGSYGFDAERDIEAITVNRWSHGYAYEYMDLHDPEWPEGQAPHEIGRTRKGRISIANSDSQAHAYLHAAVDAAWRTVGEQLDTS